MDKIFQRMLDHNFAELAGAVIHASIPIPEDLINEMLEVVLQGNKVIDSCRVFIHGQNQATANLKLALLPWSLDLKLRIDKVIDFASYSSPKLRAWLENKRLLGRLGSLFNMLPEGMNLYGNQVVLNLETFLNPEQRRMLKFVKSVDVSSEEGRLILDAKIEIT